MDTRTIAAALAMSVAAAGAARGNLTYSSFPSSTGLTLAGNAAVTGGVLRITPSTADRVGAAWFTTQQSVGAGFSTTFSFRITNQASGGADGFAFVVQNAAVSAIGAGGCQIGYDPIANSVAVEFDTYTSGSCSAGSVNDPNDNHVSVHTRGMLANSAMESASIGISSAIPNLSDGLVHTVKVDYVPGELDVYIDDMALPKVAAPLDLSATLSLNNSKAWVGFTGATGGAAERHDITAWSLTEGAPAGTGRPRTPTVTEPQYDGRIVNGQDVHMETGVFFSSTGYAHLCTDWEVWTVAPSERIWHADCVTGVERLHIHLGDGAFIGSHAGRRDLLPNIDYQLRARHRDNSGLAATEWSLWGVRLFHTVSPTANLPLLVKDVVGPVQWLLGSGAGAVLPGGGGVNPAAVVLEAADGRLLVSMAGVDGVTNLVTSPAPLSAHVEVRVRVEGGATGVSLASTSIRIVDEDCQPRMIYLPVVTLGAGGRSLFWASTSGSTYVALASQDHADLTTLARGSAMPYLSAQSGYVVEPFVTGFQLPVNIAFVPNPGPNPGDVYFYVTELYGTIKMVTRSGQVSDYKTGLLNFPPTGAFPGSGEQGLAGLVVDPSNGDLYAGVLADDGTGTHYPRVLQIKSTDGGRTASSVTPIVIMGSDPQGQSHQISNFSFGADGMLYVHMGDGFVASAGQDLSMFRGKVLRMNRAGGAPADNPFYDAADGITARDYVWEYGVRNPFGGAWRLSDGAHYIVENGPSVDRLSRLVRGRNMLYDGSDASMANFAMYNWNPAHAPVNIVFVQAGVFGGSGFPAEKMDHAFVTESGPTYGEGPQALGKRIVEFVISSAGTVVSGPTTLIEYAGSGRGSAVGLTAGPDGLYFSDLYKDLDTTSPIDLGATTYRIRYAPPPSCCPADFDRDGSIAPADIAAFVNGWLTSLQGGTTAGDFDGNGAVQPADIAAFVNAWFGALSGGC